MAEETSWRADSVKEGGATTTFGFAPVEGVGPELHRGRGILADLIRTLRRGRRGTRRGQWPAKQHDRDPVFAGRLNGFGQLAIGRIGGLDDQRQGIPGHGFAHQFDLA